MPVWIGCALLIGFFGALRSLINEKARQPGAQVVFWRGLIPCVLTAAATSWWISWPTSPIFYIATIANAFLFYLVDRKIIDANGRYGSTTTERINSLQVMSIFTLWFFIVPFFPAEAGWAEPQDDPFWYIHDPFWPSIAAIVIACLCLVTYIFIQRDANARDAFYWLLPCIVLTSIGMVLNKIAMDSGKDVLSSACAYIILNGLIMVVIAALGPRAPLSTLFDKQIVVAGSLVALATIGGLLAKNLAIGLAPNPAVVRIFTTTTPFFLAVFGLFTPLRGRSSHFSLEAASLPILSILLACISVLIKT